MNFEGLKIVIYFGALLLGIGMSVTLDFDRGVKFFLIFFIAISLAYYITGVLPFVGRCLGLD